MSLPDKRPDNDIFLLSKDETGERVYRAVWDEFYTWEQRNCLTMLHGLHQPVLLPEPLPSDDLSESDGDPLHSELNEYRDWFTIEIHDAPGSILDVDLLPLKLKLLDEGISPYPSYAACTPASSNTQCDKNFRDKASFTPFSDDPMFKKGDYLSLFNSFAWQTDFWDPDREMIFLETSRRLHHGHRFSFAEIDDLQLHYVRLRLHGSAGMLWEVSQRDRLLWPGSQMSLLPELTPQGEYENLSLHEAVSKGIVSFCDNLNCLHSACQTHDESSPIHGPKPTMTSKDFRSIHRTPCDRDCFRTYLGTDAEFDLPDLSQWDENDQSIFLSVLMFAPDSYPCDLAVICRKPCIEAYVQRCNQITDDEIEDVSEVKEENLSSDLIFEEDRLNLITIDDRLKPCYHPGPCSQHSGCTCYNNGQRCQRTCRCLRTCNLRFKGCQCTGNRPCAETADCPCQIASRECDPELCISCDARNSKGSGRACQNTILQRGRFPQLWIHTAQFGLGAFALSKMDQGKWVGEYVGEIVGEEIDPTFTIIRKFLHRNYAFGVSASTMLDSYLLGNEMRYLNHAKNPNCTAKFVFVNGDLRIGIYTLEPVKKLGELFLDYGEAYWMDGI